MKKLLLAVPLVVGASWAGASYYTGTQTQSAYDQLLVQLNEMNPFTLVKESYTSGLTKSLAITQVMDSAAADANVLFRLQHEIDHSPVGVNAGNVRVSAANIRTTLVHEDSIPESAREVMAGFTEDEPFVIETEIGFGGQSDTLFHVSPYHMQEDDTEVSFAGVDYSVNIDGDAVLGSGTLGAFEVAGSGNELAVSPGKITTDLARISKAIYSGTYGIDFDSLTLSSADNPAMNATMNSIAIHSDTDVDDDLLSSKTLLSVGHLDSELPLNAMSVESVVSNLSIEGIQSYVDTFSQMSLADVMQADDPEMTKRLMAAYLPMIGPGTGVDFAMKFNNDGGDASLTYGVGVVDASAPAYPANGLESIVTVRDLLNVLRLEAHLDADAAAIDQTPLGMFMMMPQAQQLVIADGTSYKADVSFNELIVDINGNPLAIEMMLGDELDKPLAEALSM